MNTGTEYTIYQPSQADIYYNIGSRAFAYQVVQARDYVTGYWWVKAFNAVIGQIGGYSALLWMVINFLFSEYESFKFTNSLIGKVYACTPLGPDAKGATTKEEADKALLQTLTTHSNAWYTYSEFKFAWLINKVCCCCKDRDWHESRLRRYNAFVEA